MKPHIDKWFTHLAGKRAGKYTLDRYIGSGRLGHVYQGHSEESSDWPVAVKLTQGSPRAGWENEIQKPQQLRGITGVVAYHDQGAGQIVVGRRTEVFLFTVWDFIPPGRNLKQYLREIETCPASFLIAVLEQILRVLHACEKRGVKRHGDLHPGNILVGEKDEADLDASLEAREPIYVSDFGYGVTGGDKAPKDDYQGLADIADAILEKTEWEKGTATDKQIIQGIRELLQKLLRETSHSERRTPKEILKAVKELDQRVRAAGAIHLGTTSVGHSLSRTGLGNANMSVGQYQVSEMLGDDWDRWKSLFVSSVPAKSRILEPDVSTVVTGPRGCGKTMLFRRLSERLVVECGPVDIPTDFVGFYINANDIADAFSSFQKRSDKSTDEKLVCYANLSILSDLLAVQSARCAKLVELCSEELLDTIGEWLVEKDNDQALIVGENRLEHYRFLLERIKWRFPKEHSNPDFPGFKDFSQHTWLPRLISIARVFCPWMDTRSIFIFVDDYTTPRISVQMQKVLNRLFFQRSSEFVCKLATESATTFIPVDSSGKMLQDGDDYQMIDMGEESLFMPEDERLAFLEKIFARRLSLDPRLPNSAHTLDGLLGRLGLGKLQFARLLRHREDNNNGPKQTFAVASQRRGASRPKALYHGREVFADLWSGDTRTMIQLIQELVDTGTLIHFKTVVPIDSEQQDSVLRRRGGQWLDAQARNQPTDPRSYKRCLRDAKLADPKFELTAGNYGSHLKAVVEAFVKVARQLLVSPMYRIQSGTEFREVPRMAFRIEVTDEFRVEGLAAEIYKDLIRYGMFMRDARGKSVRGAFVPRLYLRRLLLPYATLAMSKRDSVQMSCLWFRRLLLEPDRFREEFTRYVQAMVDQDPSQQFLDFEPERSSYTQIQAPDKKYNDIDPLDFELE
ncbi:MAG TPA: hypothetical protein VJU84_16215 [Pyrinomonadaceae bacterium]|nr:hypothetical protein [Pyrinomonadaceae bacterium]